MTSDVKRYQATNRPQFCGRGILGANNKFTGSRKMMIAVETGVFLFLEVATNKFGDPRPFVPQQGIKLC